MNKTYIVYADALFVFNLLQNTICFWLTGFVLEKKLSKIKIITISTITSFYDTICMIAAVNNVILYQIFYSLFHLIMLIIIFKIRNLQEIVTIFLAAFFVGGTASALAEKLSANSIFTCAALLTVVVILFSTAAGLIKIKKETAQNVYEVILSIKGNTVTLTAYYDTGNMLIDPYSKNPVIIMDAISVMALFGKSVSKHMEEYIKSGLINYEQMSNATMTSFYPLSYKTISNSTSIMPAFKISSLEIKKSCTRYDSITVGISRFKLTADNSYTVLLNQKLKPIREENSND